MTSDGSLRMTSNSNGAVSDKNATMLSDKFEYGGQGIGD